MSLAPPTAPYGNAPPARLCAQSMPSARNVEHSIAATASFGATVTTATSGLRRKCRSTNALRRIAGDGNEQLYAFGAKRNGPRERRAKRLAKRSFEGARSYREKRPRPKKPMRANTTMTMMMIQRIDT